VDAYSGGHKVKLGIKRTLTELKPVLLFEPEGSLFYYSLNHAAIFKRFTKDATQGYAKVPAREPGTSGSGSSRSPARQLQRESELPASRS